MAGEEGFEPSYAGIKIRCLNQLGDSPVGVASFCPIVQRESLKPARHEPFHVSGQLGLRRASFRFRAELCEHARPRSCHARLRIALSPPRAMRCNFGKAGADDRLEIVVSVSREKGRYFESFSIPCQRAGTEDFLR